MRNTIDIRLELESIVNLGCTATTCRNHLHKYGYAACNLKRIEIDDSGKCRQFEVKENK